MTVTAPASGAAKSAPAQALAQREDLVTLTIDDVEVSVPKGTLVIRAAELIGDVAPSPRAQKERPRMFSQRSRSFSISPSSPRPASIRARIWTNHQVPSRHGVHLPQDSCL